jgi:hypothetical protein
LSWRRLTITIYGLDVHLSSIHGRCKRFSSFRSVKNVSGAHRVPCPLRSSVCFHVAREVGAWSLTSIHYERGSCISTLPFFFIHSSIARQPFVGPWRLLQFRNLLYADGRTPWTSDQTDTRPLPKQRTNAHTDIHAFLHSPIRLHIVMLNPLKPSDYYIYHPL